MTSTVAGIHLGLDTHANRPAANTVPDGSIYSCSTHSLVYKSNFAGNSWATWATLGASTTVATDTIWNAAGDLVQGTGSDAAARLGIGTAGQVLTVNGGATAAVWSTPGGGTLAGARVTRTAGDVTTGSTTFVDLTGMSITVSTGARSALVCFTSAIEQSGGSPPQDVFIDVDVDGSRLGGTLGLYDWQTVTNSRRHPVGFCVSTATLSAASHTFKIQWRVSGGTGTMYASSNIPAIMSVSEQPW